MVNYVKVTQLSCSDPYVSSQQGCFQYHTGQTGTIQSYNYAGSVQLAATDYKNCIRQEEGYCCIEFIPTAFTLGPLACDEADNRCTSASTCSEDYILIPGVINGVGGTTAETGTSSYDRYFGIQNST
jgi:hypothetical protein